MISLEDLIDIILTEVDGKNAWEWVARISQYYRIQGSEEYHKIAIIIKDELSRIGLQDIELFKAPADGKTKTWEWIPAYQWEIKLGELWIEDPTKIKLCDYSKIPMSVITHSKSCDITAEIVDVGSGSSKEDYEKKDVSGKIVLMSSLTYSHHEIIENSGAIGVIYYPDLKRTGDNYDIHIYNSFFTTYERMDKSVFGFSISYKQAVHLKELMEKGPVKVHAKIDAKFSEGNLEVISVPIYGTEHPEEEIVVIAHLCHPSPSANDNASGSAGILELARTLSYLISKKLIEPPKRTIRFVWVPEYNGTIPWVKKYEDRVKKGVACINLDMIGEHRLKIGFPLLIFSAPFSTPSILNDITKYFVKKIADHPKGIAVNGTKAPLSYRMKAFDGGSDHTVFADSYFGIPALMLNHDDPYYHSSMDTVEYCDSSELQRVIGIAACTSYILASFDEKWLNVIWPLIHKGIYERLSNSISLLDILLIELKLRNEKMEIQQINEKIALAFDLINTSQIYEFDLINSITKLEKNLNKNIFIKSALSEIDLWSSDQNIRLKERLKACIKNIQNLDTIDIYSNRYQRKYKGPIEMDILIEISKLSLFKEFTEKLSYKFFGPIYEIINLLDKGKSILRISSFLSLQYERIILPSTIQELVNLLEDKQIINRSTI